MSINSKVELSECTIKSNCVLVEWEFEDINKTFSDLIKISSSIPRTQIIESNENYWHAICRSLVFRFPDDLEILKKTASTGTNKKGVIQVKSASRIGVSDLGVNYRRVQNLYRKLLMTRN